MGCQRSIFQQLAFAAFINASAVNGTVNGAIIDTQDFDALLFVAQLTGVTAGGDTVVLSMEDGDDPALTDAAAVGPRDVSLANSTNDDSGPSSDTFIVDAIAKIGYVGNKRYVRAVLNISGGDGIDLSGTAIAGYLHQE